MDSATDVLLDGKGPGNFEGFGDYRALLDFVTENEMIVGDSVNDELKAKMHFLNVGSKLLNEAVSSTESSTKALILRGSGHERL